MEKVLGQIQKSMEPVALDGGRKVERGRQTLSFPLARREWI